MSDYQKYAKKIATRIWKNIFFILFPLILFSLLLVLHASNIYLQKNIEEQKLLSLSFTPSFPSEYPILHSVLSASSDATSTPSAIFEDSGITAESAVVMDDASQVVLYAKNPTFRFSMASTTKIMTALVALDYYNTNDILTIKNDNVDGTILRLKEGEKYSFEDLLYAMMLPSANDAAVAIAENYPGGENAFVAKMNEKAQALHLSNTHYEDPAGLIDEGDYATVIDLARLGSFAMKNATLAKVVGTKQKSITAIGIARTFLLTNLNKLLGIDGVIGIKTGFTDEAKGVLVTSRTDGTHTLIFVVMKSDDRFLDTEKLLSFVSANTIYQSIHW